MDTKTVIGLVISLVYAQMSFSSPESTPPVETIPTAAAETSKGVDSEKAQSTATPASASASAPAGGSTMKSCRGTRECQAASFRRGQGFCLCNATYHPDDHCLIDDFAIRLQPLQGEESDLSKGVVEVRMDGVWGQVCDDYWDVSDAKVVCRQLALPSTNVRMWARTNFTEPRRMYLFSLRCTGSEDHLLQCPFRYGVGCCGSGFGRFDPVVHCQ